MGVGVLICGGSVAVGGRFVNVGTGVDLGGVTLGTVLPVGRGVLLTAGDHVGGWPVECGGIVGVLEGIGVLVAVTPDSRDEVALGLVSCVAVNRSTSGNQVAVGDGVCVAGSVEANVGGFSVGIGSSSHKISLMISRSITGMGRGRVSTL
jgi:hypothetical protein